MLNALDVHATYSERWELPLSLGSVTSDDGFDRVRPFAMLVYQFSQGRHIQAIP